MDNKICIYIYAAVKKCSRCVLYRPCQHERFETASPFFWAPKLTFAAHTPATPLRISITCVKLPEETKAVSKNMNFFHRKKKRRKSEQWLARLPRPVWTPTRTRVDYAQARRGESSAAAQLRSAGTGFWRRTILRSVVESVCAAIWGMWRRGGPGRPGVMADKLSDKEWGC